MKSSKRVIFKDPIYSWINLDVNSLGYLFDKEEIEEINNCLKEIITTKEFSRLIDIKQLSSLCEIFPGATHNRFSHSLGVFHLSKKALQNMKLIWTKQEALLLLFGALLHDIGHGFYSHTFECFVNEKEYDHETMSAKIISDKDSSISKIFEKAKYKDLNIIPENLKLFFTQKDKKGEGFWKVRSFLSSQVDIDRLDYLMRDAYYCGVDYKFGEALFLLQNVSIKSYKGKEKVCFNERMHSTIVHYLVTRYQMHKSIYLHDNSIYKDAIIYFISHFIEKQNDAKEIINLITSTSKTRTSKFINYTDSWANQTLKKMISKKGTPLVLVKLLESFFSIKKGDYKIIGKSKLQEIIGKSNLNRKHLFKNNTHHFWYEVGTPIIYKKKDPIYILENSLVKEFDGSIFKNMDNKSADTKFIYWTFNNDLKLEGKN